ncbi:DUF2809 domain-containing protein [filamentous cyanobacterium CCP5]|nr:DUF2809 domain-containing protein [filamentous cyanobacterium CCP5]
MMPRFRYYRLYDIVLITVLGLAAKFYPGPGRAWVNDAFGGIPYEIFWILLVGWLLPRAQPMAIAIAIFLVTCGLEFAQLYQPAWLQGIRATLLGRLGLGNTFSWQDFPYYGVSAVLGWWWLRWHQRKHIALVRQVRT